jgi:hypothetical protein
MRKLMLTSTVAALVLAGMTLQVSAQNQSHRAACIRALNHSTSLVKKAACDGSTGYCGCGPGWVSACAPRCCHCVPCY